MAGWLRLYRKMSEHDLWLSEKFTFGQAWVDLLLIANWRPGRIQKRGLWIDLEPGQIGWSLDSLAQRWGWSRGKVSRFLTVLQTEQQIVLQKNNVTTVITITNWMEHQSDGTADDTADSTADSTANGTADGTVSKKDKKDKKETRAKPTQSQESLERFGQWWKLYDRKTNKGQSEKLWGKLTDEEQMKCLEVVRSYVRSTPDKQFRKHPTTYLRNRAWEDEIFVEGRQIAATEEQAPLFTTSELEDDPETRPQWG